MHKKPAQRWWADPRLWARSPLQPLSGLHHMTQPLRVSLSLAGGGLRYWQLYKAHSHRRT